MSKPERAGGGVEVGAIDEQGEPLVTVEHAPKPPFSPVLELGRAERNTSGRRHIYDAAGGSESRIARRGQWRGREHASDRARREPALGGRPAARHARGGAGGARATRGLAVRAHAARGIARPAFPPGSGPDFVNGAAALAGRAGAGARCWRRCTRWSARSAAAAAALGAAGLRSRPARERRRACCPMRRRRGLDAAGARGAGGAAPPGADPAASAAARARLRAGAARRGRAGLGAPAARA